MKRKLLVVVAAVFLSSLVYGGLEEALTLVETEIELSPANQLCAQVQNIHERLEARKKKFAPDYKRSDKPFECSVHEVEKLNSAKHTEITDLLAWFEKVLDVEDKYLEQFHSGIEQAQASFVVAAGAGLFGAGLALFGGVLQTIQLACFKTECPKNYGEVYASGKEYCFPNDGLAYTCAHYIEYYLNIRELQYFIYRDDCPNVPQDLIGEPIPYEPSTQTWSSTCSEIVGTVPFAPAALAFGVGVLSGANGVRLAVKAKNAKKILEQINNEQELGFSTINDEDLEGQSDSFKKIVLLARGFKLVSEGQAEVCDFEEDEGHCKVKECQGKSWTGILKELFGARAE